MREQEKKDFLKLTPVNDTNLGIYQSALDFAFDKKNNDILNIALSGPYGSGKSSILNTYKNTENGKKLKFLHISLASFGSVEPGSIATIEGKIINQLLHRSDPDKIPQVRFKIKNKISEVKIAYITLAIIIYLISLFYLMQPDNSIVALISSDLGSKDLVLKLILMGILIVISFFGIYEIIKKQKEKGILKRINIQGNEAELFENRDESFFDKYLDDTLYLFDKSDADIIVFEDIDRFDTVKIFERLHEISTLVNHKRQIKFVYLLREDLFDPSDKTKFFDYIIPVIPVMDNINSYDKVLEFFEILNVDIKLMEDVYIRRICRYLHDVRLIKNICNEYKVYLDKVKVNEVVEHIKLFAIIVYKNICPDDFMLLQINSGFLFEAIHDKSQHKTFGYTNESEIIQKHKNIQNSNYLNLILFMVNNKCLDKGFRRYISYFYPNSLTDDEHDFVLSVLDRIPKAFDLKLVNFDLILMDLLPEDCYQKSILNFHFIDYMYFTYKGKDKEKYKTAIISNLGNIYSELSAKFINEYLEISKRYVLLLDILREEGTFDLMNAFLKNANSQQKIEFIKEARIKFKDIFEYLYNYYGDRNYINWNKDVRDDFSDYFSDLQQRYEMMEESLSNSGEDTFENENDQKEYEDTAVALRNNKYMRKIHNNASKNLKLDYTYTKELIYIIIFEFEDYINCIEDFNQDRCMDSFVTTYPYFLKTSDIDIKLTDENLQKFKIFCEKHKIKFNEDNLQNPDEMLLNFVKNNNLIETTQEVTQEI